MALNCPRCLRELDDSGERPSFCSWCGYALSTALPASTQILFDETREYQGKNSSNARAPAIDVGKTFPESIGGYRLLRKLGQGGMGSVHEAEEEVSGRRVAVKLIAPEFTASVLAVERFLQEGRLASAIAHPRCVFVLAADRVDGWPYIVMELMPGHTLKDLIESDGFLPQAQAVLKIIDVIEGLEEAHKLGVIHRDVKPSNCFLDHDGRVKIGDFGLSKSLIEVDSNLTRTGSFLGTPHYASPEQIKGELIDERSDIYSVAATLFFLLTGKPPHQANDATVALARIVSEAAPSLRSLRPEIWSSLDEVVLRGLERDRRRRYRTLSEFREALEPFLPGRITLGRIGFRIGAYTIDKAISYLPILIFYELLFERIGRWTQSTIVWAGELGSGLLLFTYFALFEIVGQSTPGKRALGLRVVSISRGGRAGWFEALIRVTLFAAIVIVPTRCYVLIWHPQGFRSTLGVGLLIQLASAPLLFVTAKSSNGYRGIHEILSQTAVILLPKRFRRRERRSRIDASRLTLHLSRPTEIPEIVGPFKIDGALVWNNERRLLLGEDQALNRMVWILLRPSDSPGLSTARRDVIRLARPRWLTSGDHEGWPWEAFVAPKGALLADLVRTKGPTDWHASREMIDALSDELEASCADGTLPEQLMLDRVWIQTDGRILLIDDELDPLPSESQTIVGEGPDARSLELLRRVAICAMSARTILPVESPTAIGGSIPGHAIPVMDRLCGFVSRFETLKDFRTEFKALLELPPELTYGQRISHAIYTFIATLVKTAIMPITVAGAYLTLAHLTGQPFEEMDDVLTLESVFVFQSIVWVLMAMLVGGGIGGMIFGVRLVRSNGRRATPLRTAWRESLRWIPLIIFGGLIEYIPFDSPYLGIRLYGNYIAVLILPLIYVGVGLIIPGQYLNDRIAGTVIMPK